MTTEEKAQVMLASTKLGAVVEVTRKDGSWGEWRSIGPTSHNITWNWEDYDYRIKKQPRVVWIYDDGAGLTSNVSQKEPKQHGASDAAKWVKFVEAQ